MTNSKFGAFLLGAGLILGISGCETAPEPTMPAPAPVIVAPAPAPEPEPVIVKPPFSVPARPLATRMSDPLVREAARHAAFMQTVGRSYSPIQNAGDLNAQLDGLASAYGARFGAGLLSYGALVAAQNPAYVDSVLQRAEAEGIDRVTFQLFQSPDYATTFSGAYSAASDIQAAWQADRATISGAAATVKQQSYDLQKDPTWTKQRADNRKERIATFKAAQSYQPSLAQSQLSDVAAAGSISSRDWDGSARSAAFWQAFGKASKPQASGTPVMTPRMKRALTLGALEILGATGQNSGTWIANYTTTPQLRQCLNWSRLHAEQCLAAAHYKYEDAFCIAEHELGDLDECLVKNGF